MQIIILAAVIFILGFGVLWGFWRKLYRTLLRLGTLLLTLGVALVLAELLGAALGRYVVALIQPLLGDSVGDLLAQPEMTMTVDALCEMISTPILFLLCYVVLKPITWILYKVLAKIFKIKGPKKHGRWSGALVGVLCGLVGVVVFVSSLFGYLVFVDNVLNAIPGESEESSVPMLEQMVQTPVVKQTYDIVGKPLFRFMTTASFEDGKINLEDETTAIMAILSDVAVLSDSSVEEFGEAQTQAVKNMANDVGESKIVSTVVASFLANASESWLQGEEALGMSKPDMGEDLQGIVDSFLVVFSSSSSATLSQDLGTFAGAFEILVESELFQMGTQDADFVTKLVSEGVVNKLYLLLDANPRMQPVKTAIRNTGVRVMMQHLGAPETLREEHGAMLEDMADTLKNVTSEDGTIDAEALSTGICDIMNSYDVPVNEEASQLIAEAITEHLLTEEILTLPPEQIADKIAERFAASGQTIQLPNLG